jgi:hypothetical protein
MLALKLTLPRPGGVADAPFSAPVAGACDHGPGPRRSRSELVS